jgi:hypothetical protein
MTRDRANELLFLWKVGAEAFPAHVINTALYVTGDLIGPDLETGARLVRVPSVPTWVEGTSLALGKRTVEDTSRVLLEAPRATDRGNA